MVHLDHLQSGADGLAGSSPLVTVIPGVGPERIQLAGLQRRRKGVGFLLYAASFSPCWFTCKIYLL